MKCDKAENDEIENEDKGEIGNDDNDDCLTLKDNLQSLQCPSILASPFVFSLFAPNESESN